KREPVRTGVAAVARAEFLAVGEPDAALAVEADLRVRVTGSAFVVARWCTGAADLLRLLHVGRRQLRDGAEELAVLQADDADRARGVERLAIAGVKGAEVLAPQFRPFLVGQPEPARRVVRHRRPGLVSRRLYGVGIGADALAICRNVQPDV